MQTPLPYGRPRGGPPAHRGRGRPGLGVLRNAPREKGVRPRQARSSRQRFLRNAITVVNTVSLNRTTMCGDS
jgi:hypothetical protein